VTQKERPAARSSTKVHPLFAKLYLTCDQDEEHEEEKSTSRRRRAWAKWIKRR
jgi:hypothetical protein